MQSQRDSRVIIDVVRYEREIGQEAPPAISRSEVLEAVIAQGVSQWKFLGTGGCLLCITLHHLELKEALFMPRAQIKSYINSSFTLWPPGSYLLPAMFSTHISQEKQLFSGINEFQSQGRDLLKGARFVQTQLLPTKWTIFCIIKQALLLKIVVFAVYLHNKKLKRLN